MFSRIIATTLFAVTFAAGAANAPIAAQKPSPASPAKTAEQDPPKDEVICTTEHTLGSHLPRRNCMTRAQQEERSRRDQEAVRNLHPTAKPMGSGQ